MLVGVGERGQAFEVKTLKPRRHILYSIKRKETICLVEKMRSLSGFVCVCVSNVLMNYILDCYKWPNRQMHALQ